MPDVLKLPPQHMSCLHGQIRMFALQRLDACQFIDTDRALSLLSSFGCPRIDLTAFHDFCLPLPVGHCRQPIPEAVRLQPPFFEQRGGMAWGDLLNDAPGLQFVCDFAPCPLTDGAPGLLWRFAGDSGDLTALLGGDLGWSPWSGCIVQALGNTERL